MMADKRKKRFPGRRGASKRGALVVRWTAGFLGVATFAGLVAGAIAWAHFTNHFHIAGITLSGNTHLDGSEVFQWMSLPPNSTLMNVDLAAVQGRLESHPYVKGARVSRSFPATLQIEIVERVPLAYINHKPFLMVDDEGVILPMRNGQFEFDVPTLSGFNQSADPYPIGERCLSLKILEAVDLLSRIRADFEALYRDLSEVVIDSQDEYVLCLAKRPTKIYLGATDLPRRVKLLQEFANTLSGIRSLSDYRYVDLRYQKQIVVKERV